MHFILIGSDGSRFYLLPNTSYTVGRQDCDLLLLKDVSISRKHAELVVTSDKVSIRDVGSRYGTFINNVKLKVNASSVLQDGATVKFGMKSIYNFHVVSIVNTTSGIKSNHKTQLKENMTTLGGVLVPNWITECNYLTVEEMMLTVKVLSAAIVGVPIVNVSYWDDYVKCVKENKPTPDLKDYVPKCSEVVIGENYSFEYKEERKELFKNKMFVFSKKSDNERMADLIKLAGGDSVSWDIHPISVEKIANEDSTEYVVMQTGNDDIKHNQSLADFVRRYTKLGNRIIPLQEIAMAIINCSCEKNCNPKFNLKACVFKTSTQQAMGSAPVLAMPTQSVDEPVDFKNETVIPQSCDVDMNVTTKTELSDPVVHDDNEGEEVIHNSISNFKRESDSNHNEMESKRIKVDDSCDTVKVDQSETLQDEKMSTQKPVSGKSLFAFPHTNIASENPNSSAAINPFFRKRKADLNDEANSSKRPSVASNESSAASPVSNNEVLNPFSNILQKRLRNNEQRHTMNNTKVTLSTRETMDNSKVTSTPKPKEPELHSLEVDFSLIPVVDSELERTFQWHTRSANKSTDSTYKSEEGIDEDMLQFINSFKDAIIVDTEDMIVKRNENVVDGDNSLSDVTNFKKFKKVQPLHKQRILIPESKYVSVICSNNNQGEVYVNDLVEEEETDNMNSEPIRPVGRQYVF